MFELRYTLNNNPQIRYVRVTVDSLLMYLKEYKEHRINLLSVKDDITTYDHESWMQNLIL